MEHVQNITEEGIDSKTLKKQTKMKQFREYLVGNSMALQIVKYLLSIRNAKEENKQTVINFGDFLGGVTLNNSSEQQIRSRIEQQRQISKQLSEQINNVQQQINRIKEQKQRKLQQQQRVKAELQAVKNKKGSKK